MRKQQVQNVVNTKSKKYPFVVKSFHAQLQLSIDGIKMYMYAHFASVLLQGGVWEGGGGVVGCSQLKI